MIFHSGIDGAGTVDLFGENKAGQLVGHRDAAHAELERRRALDLVREAVGRADDEATSPAPLFARSARNCASSSEEICFPSMHRATIAAPLRTLPRMALPSLSSAFFTTASEAFFSSIFLPAARRCGKTQTPPDASGIRPRPRRSISR